ncbi:hypothetical protein CICLE_v10013639mg, partial [Citrus x clementina]
MMDMSAMLKSSDGTTGWMLPFRKWVHAFTLPLLLDMVITSLIPSQPLVLPKFDQNLDKTNCINNIEFRFPNFSFGRSMELMAVLKNREFFILNVFSCHKSGIRNGLKSLKPVPIIVRCKSCGQVNLPYLSRCSTDRK